MKSRLVSTSGYECVAWSTIRTRCPWCWRWCWSTWRCMVSTLRASIASLVLPTEWKNFTRDLRAVSLCLLGIHLLIISLYRNVMCVWCCVQNQTQSASKTIPSTRWRVWWNSGWGSCQIPSWPSCITMTSCMQLVRRTLSNSGQYFFKALIVCWEMYNIVNCVFFLMMCFPLWTDLPEKLEQLHAIYKVLEELPPANFSTLERLIFHLVR